MSEQLPAWLTEAIAKMPPRPDPPAPGPPAPGDIRVVDSHDPDDHRQLVLVTKISDDAPWTHARPVAEVLLVSADVDLAYDDDYRVQGDAPYPMIVIAQAIGAIWVDRLGDCIHRCPQMLDPLRQIMRTGPQGFAGPLPPAGLPILSSHDPRVALRVRDLHEPFGRATDGGEILAAVEAYLQVNPDYDGPGVL